MKKVGNHRHRPEGGGGGKGKAGRVVEIPGVDGHKPHRELRRQNRHRQLNRQCFCRVGSAGVRRRAQA